MEMAVVVLLLLAWVVERAECYQVHHPLFAGGELAWLVGGASLSRHVGLRRDLTSMHALHAFAVEARRVEGRTRRHEGGCRVPIGWLGEAFEVVQEGHCRPPRAKG
jgi:hypothetical protein